MSESAVAITPEVVSKSLDTIKDDSHRSVFVPVIIDYSKKTNLNLSLKEKLACDIWVQTQSFKACSNAIKEKFGVSIGPQAIKKWMEKREHVKGYVARRLQDVGFFNNWTKERYVRCVEAHAQGLKELVFDDGQVFTFDKGAHFRLKLLGDALGYNSEAAKGTQNNIQINFTQADGRI